MIEKFHAYYEGETTRVAADRVSTEHETMATFDTLEDAQAYAKKHRVHAGRMTEFEWERRRANVPHNPKI
jgi:hypothetical protein